MSILRRFALSTALGLAVPVAACGGGSQAASGAATTSASGTSALAAKTGLPERTVDNALDAARATLGMGADKTTAAQAGVNQARAELKMRGRELTDREQAGLRDGLKSML
jgi:hypothetical protein